VANMSGMRAMANKVAWICWGWREMFDTLGTQKSIALKFWTIKCDDCKFVRLSHIIEHDQKTYS